MSARSMFVAAAGIAALLLGGCSVKEYYDEVFTTYYDKMFGNAPVIKPAELETFTATANARVVWQANIGKAKTYIFTPMMDSGGVFVADAGGTITRFDIASGKKTLSINAHGPLSGGVGGDGHMVLAGTPQGEVLAWDADGKPLWRAQLSNEVLSAPQIDQGMVVARSADNRVFALDAATGAIKWNYQRQVPTLTMRTNAGVMIEHGGVLAGFPGGKLVVLLLENGTVVWESAVALPKGANELERVADVASAPLIDGSQVCAVAFQGRVACFELTHGAPQWAHDVSSVMGMAADSADLYISDEKSAVVTFNKTTGAAGWRQEKLYGRQISAPVVTGDFVAVGDYQGYVHFLKREDGSLAARVATDGSPIISQPLATDTGIIVQTQKGGVFAIAVQ